MFAKPLAAAMMTAALTSASFVSASFVSSTAALAQVSDDVVKIGVLSDMNGPASTPTGKGSGTAAEMAVEDFGGSVLGKPIQVIVGDHQLKPDIGATLARRWYDVEQVDLIVDVPVSAVGLAVQNVAGEKKRMFITTATGAKMGKSVGGAVWLDPDRTSPFDFYQYWYNGDDRDVERFLKLFTFLPLDEISRLAALQGAEINEAKKTLATEATALIHGREAADQTAETARAEGADLQEIAPRDAVAQFAGGPEYLQHATPP